LNFTIYKTPNRKGKKYMISKLELDPPNNNKSTKEERNLDFGRRRRKIEVVGERSDGTH
jgi:hypothetical protein